MVFNSVAFAIFFMVFFFLYWFIFSKTIRWQNFLILAASYLFYSFTDWRFLTILILSSIFNYWVGIGIERSIRYRRLLLWMGMVQGIGSLIFFKYFNFFVNSFNTLFTSLNIHVNFQVLSIIVPVGISFFTFRTMSYLLDIDKGKIKASTNWVSFFVYVAFFPSLLSGPIDKARTFMPQLERRREFSYVMAADGMRQILWGLFKKMVVADNCAIIADGIFSNYHDLPGSSLLIGAFFYTIQMYADFSGYSDMAIGLSKLLGFKITPNFNFPFFARNIADFWRRWHISLTTWLTEYVFTPLSITFRDLGKAGVSLAIIINFTLVGIWHGANWTYVAFGFMHGCYFIPLIIKGTMNKKKRVAKEAMFPALDHALDVFKTFTLVMLTFVVFRASSISDALQYYNILFSQSLFSTPVFSDKIIIVKALIFILIMMLTEWVQREQEHGLVLDYFKSPVLRASVYCVLIFMIIWLGSIGANQFIYFNF